MADNGFKINKSANFNPQAGTPANPIDGDFFYDSTAQSFAYYHNGSWANFDSVGTVSTALWLTSAQFTPTVVRNSVVKVTGGVSTAHLAGISASFSAKRITVYNAGTALIVVEPNDAMEPTANNRIQTPTGGSMNLVAGEVAVFTYDIVVSRWLLVSISSQAGAQVIATTTNPGLVTLHQASLFPLDGIVLSDGDLNTANGVVGLDANKAATITAPTSAVTTLTLNAFTGAAASALVLQGGSLSAPLQRILSDGSSLAWYTASSVLVGSLHSDGLLINQADEIRQYGPLLPDETDFVLNDSNVYLGRRKLHFSKDDGFGNIYDNYMQYTYLGGLGRRGMKFVNQTNTGTATFTVEGQGDGFGFTRCDLILHASTGSDAYITNQQGLLYLGFLGLVSINASFPNSGNFAWTSNSVNLWEITGNASGGILQALTTNRIIRNVADPVQEHDAATRNYVNANTQNYLMNGAFDFWQRLVTGTSSFTVTSLGETFRYTADRWYYYSVSSSDAVISQIAAPSSETDLGAKYTLRCARNIGETSTVQRGIVQEIDREFVKSMRGKTFTLHYRLRAGSNYTGTFRVDVVTGTGDVNQLSGISPYYTGGTAIATSGTLIPPGGGAFTDYYVDIPAIPTNVTTVSVQFNHLPQFNAVGQDSFEISLVHLMEGTGQRQVPFRRTGGSWQTDFKHCQQYYERSYGYNQGLGIVNNGFNMFQGAITTTLGGNRYWPSVYYNVPKWIDGAAYLPAVTLYDFAGNASRVTVNGTSNKTYTIDASGDKTFRGHIASADGATADLIEFYWVSDAEIKGP